MSKVHKLLFNLVIFVGIIFKACNGLCPSECHCTNQPKRCAPGVSLVTDGCKCCTICARQENDWCDEENVCDTHRGLVCDYTDTANGERGLCKVQNGRSCFYKGRSYVNGEMFRPTCKHQCWCMDKEVGCLSICPHETLVPKSDVCPGARLEDVPGQCCKAWVCAGLDNTPKIDMDRFWDELVDDDREEDFTSAIIPQNDLTSLDPSAFDVGNSATTVTPHINDIGRNNEVDFHDDGPAGDDLLDYQIAFANHRRWAELEFDSGDIENGDDDYDNENYWEETNEFFGDDDAKRKRKIRIKEGCKVQTSKWTDCSKTCGLGISSRVTNKNSKCATKRETRLCQLRVCGEKITTVDITAKRGRKRCSKHSRPKRRQHFEYAGCKSTKSYKPRYCGNCAAHSCYPQSTKTVKMKFRCNGQPAFTKKMMWIKKCRCSPVTLFHESYYNLFNDTAPSQPPS